MKKVIDFGISNAINNLSFSMHQVGMDCLRLGSNGVALVKPEDGGGIGQLEILPQDPNDAGEGGDDYDGYDDDDYDDDDDDFFDY